MHARGDRPHVGDPGKLAPLAAALDHFCQESELGRSYLLERLKTGFEVGAGVLEFPEAAFAEQQHLGDLLGIAVGVQRQGGDRLELAMGDRHPRDVVVGPHDREVDDPRQHERHADQEKLEGDDLRAQVHGREASFCRRRNPRTTDLQAMRAEPNTTPRRSAAEPGQSLARRWQEASTPTTDSYHSLAHR